MTIFQKRWIINRYGWSYKNGVLIDFININLKACVQICIHQWMYYIMQLEQLELHFGDSYKQHLFFEVFHVPRKRLQITNLGVRPRTTVFFSLRCKTIDNIFFSLFFLWLPNWTYPKGLRLGFGLGCWRTTAAVARVRNFFLGNIFMRKCYPKNKIPNHRSSRTPPQFRDLIEILVRIF